MVRLYNNNLDNEIKGYKMLYPENTLHELFADYLDLNLPEEKADEITKDNVLVSDQIVESVTLTNEIQLSSNQNQIALEQIVQQIQLLNKKIDLLQNHQNTPLNGTTTFTNLKNQNLTINNNLVVFENSIKSPEINRQQKFKAKLPKKKYTILANEPPFQGGKLGRDKNENPPWYREDSNQKGNYVNIEFLE